MLRMQSELTHRRVLVLYAMLLSSLSGEAFGKAKADLPSDTKNPHIVNAARHYSEYDFDSAMSSLQKAIFWPGNRASDIVWIHLMEGVLYVGVRNESAARSAFMVALNDDPLARLPVECTPSLCDLLERARREVVSRRRTVQPATGHPPEPAGSIWEQRRLGALAEVGWNSVPGAGLITFLHVLDKLSIELGAGLGELGYKTGARAKYYLLPTQLSPFFAVGGTMLWSPKYPEEDIPLDNTPYLLTTCGIEAVAENGLSFMLTIGFAFAFLSQATTDQVVHRGGDLDKINSGLSVSLALGYRFRTPFLDWITETQSPRSGASLPR